MAGHLDFFLGVISVLVFVYLIRRRLKRTPRATPIDNSAKLPRRGARGPDGHGRRLASDAPKIESGP